MSRPIAVIIGDIHFTPSTLKEATQSFLMAANKARELNVPLILNGDTLDSKAIIRSECANRLIEILDAYSDTKIYVNVGNHELINEKSEDHSLNFLKPYCDVIQSAVFLAELNAYIIPYMHSAEQTRTLLDDIRKHHTKCKTLIMHQGVETADMGHYVRDTTSLPKDCYDGFRVVSSHYHKRQDIKCGEAGLFSYIGNPHTLTFGEANDPLKGFAVLTDDGSLEHVPINLRKHIVVDIPVNSDLKYLADYNKDILWLKINGPASELTKLSKNAISQYVGHMNFKLDLIPTDKKEETILVTTKSPGQILDSLIDSMSETEEHKVKLKALWKELV